MRSKTLWIAFGLCWLWNLAAAAQGRGPTKSPVSLVVVGTADFHGALSGDASEEHGPGVVGGMEAIAAYFQLLREKYADSLLLLDAGDIYQGSLISYLSEGAAVIDFYNEVGYQAAVIGNHEFDFGPVGPHIVAMGPREDSLGALKQRLRQARFPFLAANIYHKAEGKPVSWDNLFPYVVLERRGVKVGIIGLAAQNTALVTLPANVKTLEFMPLLSTLRKILPEVRAKGASVIIVLAHAGIDRGDKGAPIGPAAELARALKPGEVDLIVTGHDHATFADKVNGIPVIQSLPKGVSFMRADLKVDATTGKVLPEQTVLHLAQFFRRVDAEGKPAVYEGKIITPVPRFAQKLDALQRAVARTADRFLGFAQNDLKRKLPLDSPVGNLVCDAMRAADPTIQIAMYNRGGLRTDIPKGRISFGLIYEVIPFDNELVVVTLSGAQIREILEQGLSGDYGLMEISGLSVSFDRLRPKGQRCLAIKTASGQPLADQRSYHVATNDFLLGGGDGYATFSRGTLERSTGKLVRDALARYIKSRGKIALPRGGRYQPWTADLPKR